MSLSSLAGNVNVFAPEALTYGGAWSATQTYVLHNVVFGSNNVAYVLAVASNRGTDPTTAPAPSPWVVFGSATPTPPTPGATALSLSPLDATTGSGVWLETSGYAVGNVVRDNSAGGFGGLYVCNTEIVAPVAPAVLTAPHLNQPTPWTPMYALALATEFGSGLNLTPSATGVALSTALTAGAGINLTPNGANNTIEISAVSAGAGGLKLIATGTALTAKVVGGTPVGNVLTVPLQQFDLGLTAGNTYLITMVYDGGANTTWTGSSPGSSITSSPFISNTATGAEDSLPSLFGYGQQNTFSAPTSVSAVSNGTNPLIDFPPLTYQVFYPALDANVYLNVVLNGGATNATVANVAWTEYTPGWRVWLSATDLGATPA